MGPRPRVTKSTKTALEFAKDSFGIDFPMMDRALVSNGAITPKIKSGIYKNARRNYPKMTIKEFSLIAAGHMSDLFREFDSEISESFVASIEAVGLKHSLNPRIIIAATSLATGQITIGELLND